jgi:hypothetical protein
MFRAFMKKLERGSQTKMARILGNAKCSFYIVKDYELQTLSCLKNCLHVAIGRINEIQMT